MIAPARQSALPGFTLTLGITLAWLSLIVLPSTHGERSSIVRAPTVVSTARSDVHVVVTEHGVADLRGLDEEERAEALIAVADPAHRAALRT